MAATVVTTASPTTQVTLSTRRVPAAGWVRQSWPAVAVFAGLIAVWYLVTWILGDRSFLMPAPHEVVRTFAEPAVFSEIMVALGRSALVALTGLVIAIVLGVGWAVAMSTARWVERSLFPYAVVLQCIPILALVPLIGFWFGFEFPARVIVCVLIALFPMVSNTLFGLQSVDTGLRELFALAGAGRVTTLRKLALPAALPAIFAGMRISAGLSVVGAIVGDFFFRRGQPGIGALISNYQSRVQSAELFAAIIVASLFGVAIFWFFGWASRRVVGRWYDA